MPIFFRQGGPRAEPWPLSLLLRVNGEEHGLMTGKEIQSDKPQDMAGVSPSDYREDAENPAKGTVHSWGPMPLGMGLRKQKQPNPRDDGQYSHGINADLSAGPWLQGPSVSTLTPATVDSTNGIVAVWDQGGSLYALNGRYALARSSDASWPVSQDFGSSKAGVDVCTVYTAALSAVHGVVAMGDSENFWYFTGGTWTQHASLKMRACAVAGREFYRAHSVHTQSKVSTDSDITVAGNYGNENAFTIGQKDSGITRMATTANGTLFTFKTDGIYTLKGEGSDDPGGDVKLYSFTPDADNFKAISRWGNDLYFSTTYDGCWRLNEDGSLLTQVGPELLLDNDSEVSGTVTSLCGTRFCLYAGIWNPDTNKSYVLKFLGMTEKDGRPHPIWHGSITEAYASKKITALHESTVGADTGHTRLYLGFSDGVVGWFQLSCKPNPAACSNYEFSTADGEVSLGTWTGGFDANHKALTQFSVTSRNAGGAQFAQLEYRLDASTGSYTALGTNFTLARQIADFPDETAAVQADLKVILNNQASTDTAEVVSVALHHRLQTPLRKIHPFTILCADGLTDRQGKPLLIGADEIRRVLEAAADPEASPGSITAVLPDERSYQVAVVTYGVTQAWDNRRQVREAIKVGLIELQALNTYGTYEKLEAAPLYSDLESFTYEDLSRL